MSPMQRTQKWLRENGYMVARTEHWNHYAKIRQDLFGFIDTLAVNDKHMLAIQSTVGSHHAERVTKIKSLPVARLLAFHAEIEVWSWDKRGDRGKRKLWTLRREPITAQLLPKRSLLRRKIEEGTWEP